MKITIENKHNAPRHIAEEMCKDLLDKMYGKEFVDSHKIDFKANLQIDFYKTKANNFIAKIMGNVK